MRSGNVPICELHLVVAVSTSNWNLILFQAFNCVFKSTFEYHWYYLGRGAKRAIKLPQITDNYMSRHVWVYIFVGICVTRGPLLTKATPFFLSYVGKFNTKHNTVMEEKMGEKNTVIIHRKNPMMDCSSELGKNGKKKQKKEEFSNRLLNCHAWDLGGVKWGSNSKWRGHTFRTNSRQGLLIELHMIITIQHQCIHPPHPFLVLMVKTLSFRPRVNVLELEKYEQNAFQILRAFFDRSFNPLSWRYVHKFHNPHAADGNFNATFQYRNARSLLKPL